MDDETPMIETTAFVAGAVDYKNRPALRSNSGCWRSAAFIIGFEITEMFASIGVSANLIMYLTGPLGESTATAAANVNAFSGVGSLASLFGAFVADAFLGRYRTILFAFTLYILALGLLTLSTLLPSLLGSTSSSPPLSQVILFFSSLSLLTIAQGGHKSCTQAFGADQFDAEHPLENDAKHSFFNWWFFWACSGSFVISLIIVYVQDNLGWTLGFGIPCIAMVFTLLIFLVGTKNYRYAVFESKKSQFSSIRKVFVATFRKTRAVSSSIGTTTHESSDQFKFLNKALIASKELEETKSVVRLIPIWTTCLIYGIVFAQKTTFFTKQGATMERTIFSGFQIPAASLQCFANIAVLAFLPIYDRVLVPIARAITGNSSGITTLQRIGTGIFISVFSMIIAALVETRRLAIAEEHGLVDDPSSTVPVTVWWLVPQYVLFGIADVFILVGLQEFFYEQVAVELRSVGIALFHNVLGVGSILSSLMVSVIDKASREHDGGDSWFSDNLNKARLHYFYWLLACLSALQFAAFLHFSRLYFYDTRAL